MKVTIKTTFRDKNNWNKVYLEGETFDFSDERAKELIEKGLVEKPKKKKSETIIVEEGK